MKKLNLLILSSLALFVPLVSCSNQGQTSTPPSTTDTAQDSTSTSESNGSEAVVIGKVEINGPKTMKVGQTSRLFVSVQGDETNAVTWSCSDPTLLTVEENGSIQALKAGNVTITATSKLDSTKSGDWTIAIQENTQDPTSMEVSIQETEGIQHDEKSNIYYVDLNTTFHLIYTLDVEKPTPAESVSYRIAEDQSGNHYYDYLEVNLETGQCHALRPLPKEIEQGYILVQVVYSFGTNKSVIGNIKINIVDRNSETLASLNEALTNASALEATTMSQATISRDVAVPYNTSKKTMTYDYFQNGVYNKTYDEVEKTNTYYYSGLKENSYYNLEFDPDLRVFSKGSKDEYADKYNLAYENDTRTYGLINNLANNIVNGSYYISISSFKSDEIYQNLEVKKHVNTYELTSKFTTFDYNTYKDVEGEISLTVNFDEDFSLSSYALNYVTKDGGQELSHFLETASFTYEGKTNDDSTYEKSFQLDQYIIKAPFELKNLGGTRDPEGRYDFSNTELYLDQSYVPEEEEINGKTVPVYTMTPNKSFVFSLDDETMNSISNSLEFETLQPSYQPLTSQVLGQENDDTTDPVSVCRVTPYGPGVFAIQNQPTAQQMPVIGSTLVTLTSSKGFQKTIKIEYENYGDPTNVSIESSSLIPDANGVIDFGTITEGEYSDTFQIHTTPDLPHYQFGIKVTNTETNTVDDSALSLVEFEQNNPDNLYGYGIKGLKPGTYSFYLYIEGYESVKTKEMKIVVSEAPSESEILAGITQNTYEYTSSGFTFTMAFSAEKKLTLTQNMNGTIFTDVLDFTIVQGKIHFDGGVENVMTDYNGMPVPGKYIALGTQNTSGDSSSEPYLKYLRSDIDMKVAADFSIISPYVVTYYDTYATKINFEKTVSDPLTYYTFKLNFQDAAYQWYFLAIKFDEDITGKTMFISPETNQIISTSTFDYTRTESDSMITIAVSNFQHPSEGKYVLFGDDVSFTYYPANKKSLEGQGTITDESGKSAGYLYFTAN